MQRYFVEEKKDDFLFVEESDIHHLTKVMRNKNGDEVIGLYNGRCYLCRIEEINEGKLKIIEEMNNDTELPNPVTLIYSMPKGDKFELVLQKATELGVSKIIPMISKRTVVKLDDKSYAKKKVRYEKILKEAAEQSYRNIIPEIGDFISIKNIQQVLEDVNLVAYEEDAKNGEISNFRHTLENVQLGQSVSIIVGCEGGFEQTEIDYLTSLGVISCSLGKRILRSETAPLYMLSCIGYELELKNK